MSGGTLDTASWFSISFTRLSRSMVELPISFYYRLPIPFAVRTPKVLLPLVWPLPRSLATTSGISVDFFSSPYLDVSVQAVPLIHLWIQCMMTGRYSGRILYCFRLPEAYRRSLRPSSASNAKAFPLRPY